MLNYFPISLHRSSRSAREIIPFDKWELLPEQIEHEEELGRGAFGVVYKATLKRRVGIEVFDTEKTLKPKEPCQVVAVKVLQGTLNFKISYLIKYHSQQSIITQPRVIKPVLLLYKNIIVSGKRHLVRLV